MLRQPDLYQRLQSVNGIEPENVSTYFDMALSGCMHARWPRNIDDAASLFTQHWLTSLQQVADPSPIEASIGDITANICDCSQELLEQCNVGCQLATDYFRLSLSPPLHSRITQLRPLHVEYNFAHDSQRRGTPMSHLMVSGNPTIVMRFCETLKYGDYIALPFMALHEYSAHVVATDNDYNPWFNEGWMIYAAAMYLLKTWLNKRYTFPAWFSDQHADVENYLYSSVADTYKPALNFARHMYHLLGSEVFDDLTYQLAVARPTQGASAQWPTHILRAMERALKVLGHEQLHHIITNSQTSTLR